MFCFCWLYRNVDSSDSDQENCSIRSANRDAEMPEFFCEAFKSFVHFEEEKAQYEKPTLQTFVSSRTIKVGNADLEQTLKYRYFYYACISSGEYKPCKTKSDRQKSSKVYNRCLRLACSGFICNVLRSVVHVWVLNCGLITIQFNKECFVYSQMLCGSY